MYMYMCGYPRMNLSIRRWMLCDPPFISRPVSFYCCLFRLDTLLFRKSDHVGFLFDLIRNTYFDHVILVGMVVVVV